MSASNFDSIEYRCAAAFGGGTHIRIDRVRGSSGAYQLTEAPVACGEDGGRTVQTRELTREEVERLVTAVRDARISVFPPHVLGLDGATSTLKLIAGFSEITLCWWSTPDDGWAELRRVVDAIRAA